MMRKLNVNEIEQVNGGDAGAVAAAMGGAKMGARFGPWGALAGAFIGVGVYYLP